jgi:hypothetical protein
VGLALKLNIPATWSNARSAGIPEASKSSSVQTASKRNQVRRKRALSTGEIAGGKVPPDAG